MMFTIVYMPHRDVVMLFRCNHDVRAENRGQKRRCLRNRKGHNVHDNNHDTILLIPTMERQWRDNTVVKHQHKTQLNDQMGSSVLQKVEVEVGNRRSQPDWSQLKLEEL